MHAFSCYLTSTPNLQGKERKVQACFLGHGTPKTKSQETMEIRRRDAALSATNNYDQHATNRHEQHTTTTPQRQQAVQVRCQVHTRQLQHFHLGALFGRLEPASQTEPVSQTRGGLKSWWRLSLQQLPTRIATTFTGSKTRSPLAGSVSLGVMGSQKGMAKDRPRSRRPLQKSAF